MVQDHILVAHGKHFFLGGISENVIIVINRILDVNSNGLDDTIEVHSIEEHFREVFFQMHGAG